MLLVRETKKLLFKEVNKYVLVMSKNIVPGNNCLGQLLLQVCVCVFLRPSNT